MIIFKSASQLTRHIDDLRNKKKKIGFVPTMGALHTGHLSLIAASRKEADITVCSIFINPTQFNNRDDFNKYPVTLENDILMLSRADCDILFIPTEQEIYTPAYQIEHYELGRLETIWEGEHRPGHFQGVCQVVDRLLNIVKPHLLFLGQKDYQQCMVIRLLVNNRSDHKDIQLVFAPTIRETDGLAMSSRNMRLHAEQRKKAVALFQCLEYIRNHFLSFPFPELETRMTKELESIGFSVDYVSICSADTLEKAKSDKEPLVALIAASIDSIRLIDNMRLN